MRGPCPRTTGVPRAGAQNAERMPWGRRGTWPLAGAATGPTESSVLSALAVFRRAMRRFGILGRPVRGPVPEPELGPSPFWNGPEAAAAVRPRCRKASAFGAPPIAWAPGVPMGGWLAGRPKKLCRTVRKFRLDGCRPAHLCRRPSAPSGGGGWWRWSGTRAFPGTSCDRGPVRRPILGSARVVARAGPRCGRASPRCAPPLAAGA